MKIHSKMFYLVGILLAIEILRVCPRTLQSQEGDTVEQVLESIANTSNNEKHVFKRSVSGFKCGYRPIEEVSSFSGIGSFRIVGGKNSVEGGNPWQVSIKQRTFHFCGGSIINDEWVISAAHCFASYRKSRINELVVTVGEYKLHTTDSEEQQFGVVDYFIHPQFNAQNPVNYDVALVHLKGKIVFGTKVQPVCLPDETQVFPAGTMCVGSGWGKTVEGGEVSEILQEVDLPLISAQQCDKVLTTLKLASMDETMTCAGFPEGGRDACQGDSGGPLVCKRTTGLWTLMGVTSWGVGCARKWAGDATGSNLGTPGVYAKVSSFLPYILEKISIGRAYVDEGECSSSGITLSGVQGSIQYPRTIGRNYSENSLCVWNIVVPTGQNILIKITQMDIEEAVTCDRDYLAVYSNKGVLVGKLCGKELPAPLLVDTDKAQIKFISDSSNSGWGFALNYSAVDENSQKASGCGSTAVLVEQSKIDTANYPLAYPANADCHWLIKAPVNNIIKLQFLDFEVEQSKECMYDSVSIFNDQSQQVLIAKLCGLSVPGPVWSKGNTMSIHFISDKENNFRGFKADFFFLPAGSEILKQWQPVAEAITKFVPVADCGVMPIEPQWKNKHIVGGEEAVPHSWPWQATLMYQGTPYCAGAVVDSNWIVTAASCFNMSPLRKYWRVITGDHDRNLVEGTEQDREVIKIIFHPSYNLYTEDYDLALVKVSDLIFNDHVRPVCLPSVSSPVEPSSVCVGSGWGVINEGQQDSSSDCPPEGCNSGIKIATRLQQQYIPIQSTTVCKESYQHPGGITDRMMCAGFPTTGSASCYGDVGVPLVCEEDGRYVLYGLQSWGIGCGTKPGVYTRVRVLIDWIRSVKDYKPGKRATGTSADEPSMSIRTNECPSNEVLAGLQGSFTSPGYPLEYAGYLNCSWVLNLEPSSTVQISIYNLSITQSNECERAFLRIREEIGNQSILLGQYCGVFNHPLVVKSSAGSVVRFQFTTDEPAMEKGFALNYTVNKNIAVYAALDQKDAVSEVDFKQNCGDVLLMGPSGSEIRSPRYPENYPKNTSCSWRIVAPLNFIIRIDFKTFSTESSSVSCTDNLDIYEGAGAPKELLAHFFGRDLPPSVKSSGPELTIVFRATCEQTSKGFLLGYSFMEMKPTSGVQMDENLLSASCPVLVLIQELPGELKSPNYPDHYPGNLDCMWTIYSTSGKKILLEVVDFVTEDTRGCNWDHLDIYDGPNAVSKLLASLCGEQSPMKLISSSSFVSLKFKTDSSAGARGFRIKYSETEGVGLGTRTENTFNVRGDSYPCGITKFKPCGLGQQLMQEQSRIINGILACPNSWPWQVSLQYKGQHYCGGCLIHQNWVLTAGHCDFNRDTDAVVLGAHDLSSKTEQIQVIQVIAKYNHNNYGGFPPANDLALLRLQTPARLGDTVIPICLPDGGVEVDASWSCVSTGWGATDLVNQVFPNKLNQASLPIVGSKSCADYWGDVIKPTHVCAGAAGSTSCRGDSGGPLECQKDSLYLLIGVVSWGNKECVTQAPAVYTKVSAYRQWISKITNGEV